MLPLQHQPVSSICIRRESLCFSVASKESLSKRCIKPEIYPLFAAVGVAVVLCGFTLARNLALNSDVRVTKDNRSAGVLENYKEGEIYRKHSLRRYVADKEPQIMPTINKYFSSESEVYILHGCLQLTHQWMSVMKKLI